MRPVEAALSTQKHLGKSAFAKSTWAGCPHHRGRVGNNRDCGRQGTRGTAGAGDTGSTASAQTVWRREAGVRADAHTCLMLRIPGLPAHCVFPRRHVCGSGLMAAGSRRLNGPPSQVRSYISLNSRHCVWL